MSIESVNVRDRSPSNLLPKFCPIDGSELEIAGSTLVCDAESHNWELELGDKGYLEFYILRLSGY